MLPTRRAVLAGFLAVPALSAALPALAAGKAAAERAATPACHDGDAPTIAQTEGPYFSPGAPLKRDFSADSPRGERITLAGLVLTTACRPVPRALIELWHADERGDYDNAGFRLRGHQFADDEGRWWFDTIIPGLYTGRTRHYHLKVQRRGGRVLTTQLYFPGEAGNASDGIFDERLLLEIRRTADGKFGRFDFVVG